MRSLLLLAPLALAIACGDEPVAPPVCTPGASAACVGPGGCAGGQVCNAEGSGFAACDCGAGVDGGPRDDGGDPPVDSGRVGMDSGGPPDGSTGCDPLANTGCAAGERCAWIMDPAGVNYAECAPVGTVDALEACTRDSMGVDDCRAGLTCVLGYCHQVCSTLGGEPMCPSGFLCSRHAGILDDIGGVCDPECNPVTQVRLTDDAPDCGSVDSETPELACVGVPNGPFTCARTLSTTATHGTVVSPVFLNSCAPGYAPLAQYGTDVVCVAFCTPVVTHMGNVAGLDGMPPHTCAARGATGATEECRYLHALQSTPNELGNLYGACLDPARYAAAGTPFPACGTVTTADDDIDGIPNHAEAGCAPLP